MKKYSVMLLYPDYLADPFGETYYDHVRARSPKEAVLAAYADCLKTNGWNEQPPLEDFSVLLVIEGWHTGLEAG